jgi:hypothetical protein
MEDQSGAQAALNRALSKGFEDTVERAWQLRRHLPSVLTRRPEGLLRKREGSVQAHLDLDEQALASRPKVGPDGTRQRHSHSDGRETGAVCNRRAF